MKACETFKPKFFIIENSAFIKPESPKLNDGDGRIVIVKNHFDFEGTKIIILRVLDSLEYCITHLLEIN